MDFQKWERLTKVQKQNYNNNIKLKCKTANWEFISLNFADNLPHILTFKWINDVKQDHIICTKYKCMKMSIKSTPART